MIRDRSPPSTCRRAAIGRGSRNRVARRRRFGFGGGDLNGRGRFAGLQGFRRKALFFLSLGFGLKSGPLASGGFGLRAIGLRLGLLTCLRVPPLLFGHQALLFLALAVGGYDRGDDWVRFGFALLR